MRRVQLVEAGVESQSLTFSFPFSLLEPDTFCTVVWSGNTSSLL
jgi:hypothetical protein